MKMAGKNILITGGCGFIGSHLAEYHLDRNDAVWIVDDLSTGNEKNIDHLKKKEGFQFIQTDLLTWSKLQETILWTDQIYHMAAVVGVFQVLKDPLRVLSVNIKSCERILNAVQTSGKNIRILLASSSEVYGPGIHNQFSEDDNLIIESKAQSRWVYPISKLSNEAEGLAYFQKWNMPITVVRLFNTIGPKQTGRYGMVVPRFVQQAVNHEPITVFGNGNQTRSFCDVRDVVVMLDKLAKCEHAIGKIVNVGNDHEISINALAEKVKQLANSHSPIQHISYTEAYGADYLDILRRRPNLKKLFNLIDFKHKWDIEDTIRYLIQQVQADEITN